MQSPRGLAASLLLGLAGTASADGLAVQPLAVSTPNVAFPDLGPAVLSNVIADQLNADGTESIVSASDTVAAAPTPDDLRALPTPPDAATPTPAPQALAPARRRTGYGCYDRTVQDKVKQVFGLVEAYTNSFTAHWCGYKGGDIPGLVTSQRASCSTSTGPGYHRTLEECTIDHNSDVTGSGRSHAHFIGQLRLSFVVYDSSAGLIWHGNGQSTPRVNHRVILSG